MSTNESPPTRRQLQAKETKKKIYEASIRLFKLRGFDMVTIDDIMEFAGFSKGSFYTYFDSKESILVQQFHDIDDAYKQAFKKLPDTATAQESLMLLFNTMTHYVMDECGIEIIKVIYSNQISRGKSVKILNNKNRAFYHYAKDAMQKGISNGEFIEDIKLKDAVEWLTRSARGLIYDWCLYDGEFNLKEEGQKYFSEILRLIRKAQNPT